MPESISKLEGVIARAASVDVDEIRGLNRHRSTAEARHAVWFVAHDHLGYSLKFIGDVYGRDHTTIMHGVKRMREHKRSQKIIEGIRSVAPSLLERAKDSDGRGVENWQFA
jgi:chromosomal replication initiator protein